jgi:hypothetical protein
MSRAFDDPEELTEEAAFALLQGVVNRWYTITVKHTPWVAKDGSTIIFAKADSNEIFKTKDGGEVLPDKFFQTKTENKIAEKEVPEGVFDGADDEIPF